MVVPHFMINPTPKLTAEERIQAATEDIIQQVKWQHGSFDNPNGVRAIVAGQLVAAQQDATRQAFEEVAEKAKQMSLRWDCPPAGKHELARMVDWCLARVEEQTDGT